MEVKKLAKLSKWRCPVLRTVGKLLAERLGCAFYDADDYHTPENKGAS